MLMTEKLKAGTVWVNNYRATSFTSPFGGLQGIGHRRESGSDTIKEYLDTKCVWISSDLDVPNPFIGAERRLPSERHTMSSALAGVRVST
jgi:aldehyde dehydrogenase (NAD+)